MKNDYTFKLLGAVILAGVMAAVFNPSHPLQQADRAAGETPPIVVQAE